MNSRLSAAVEGLPVRRVTRALASRISAVAAKAADALDEDKKLTCNGCGHSVAQYVQYAGKPNLCPRCGSTAKERLVLALLEAGQLTIPTGGRYLHIAPSEKRLMIRLAAAGSYVAADLHPGVYEGHDVIELDVTQLANRQAEFGTFDIIYASHVLEHIPDDAAAMDAIAASLNPGGEFWMLVPLADGPTIDGDGTESTRQREQLFGQWDHVRQYGHDVHKRLESAGFDVATLGIADVAANVIFEAGLAADDIVWKCTVSPTGGPGTEAHSAEAHSTEAHSAETHSAETHSAEAQHPKEGTQR